MDTIRISNLRCLEDTGVIKMRPLMIVVGANSSGKSTFVRSFPLFKQSLDVKKRGPILWYGNEVDFGSYDTALSRGKDLMVFEFGYSNEKPASRGGLLRTRFTSLVLNKIRFEISKGKRYDYISKLDISFCKNQTLTFLIDNAKNVKIIVNGRLFDVNRTSDYLSVQFYESSGIIPSIHYVSSSGQNPAYELITKALKKIIESNISKVITDEFVERNFLSFVPFMSREELRDNLKNKFSVNVDDAFICELADWLIYYNIDDIIDYVNAYIRSDFVGVNYIKPLRASAERYYRVQNLSVEELESDGRNLAMFLNEIYADDKLKNEYIEWTKTHFNFELLPEENNGQVSIKIKDLKNNAFDNIADTGSGYAQILPIITTMWQARHKIPNAIYRFGLVSEQHKTIVIEQPELHLHPNYQVLFADTLVASIDEDNKAKMKNNYVIETHSKDIIGRIGLKIEEKKISPDDVSILLFDNDHKIRVSSFDNNGMLIDWPIGFFDPS